MVFEGWKVPRHLRDVRGTAVENEARVFVEREIDHRRGLVDRRTVRMDGDSGLVDCRGRDSTDIDSNGICLWFFPCFAIIHNCCFVSSKSQEHKFEKKQEGYVVEGRKTENVNVIAPPAWGVVVFFNDDSEAISD
jgi:hypothetical protein